MRLVFSQHCHKIDKTCYNKKKKFEYYEPIGGGLGANPDARKVSLQEVLYEGGLAGGVLAHQQDHGLGVKVGVVQLGRVEVVELVGLLQGQELALVDLLEALGDILKELVLACVLLGQPAEHLG